MSEIGATFSAFTQDRQARHAEWKAANLKALRASGLVYSERPESCLFRVAGKPRVDFYPSTGRWRIVGDPRRAKLVYRGGAAAFLRWWGKQ